MTPEEALLRSVFAQNTPVVCQIDDQLLLTAEGLERLITPLDEREREIIRLRVGTDQGYFRTLEEVGELVNLTKERIRQIEARALAKLRHPETL